MSTNKIKLDLKLVELSEKLRELLNSEKLSKLEKNSVNEEISKLIYSHLVKYPSDLEKLEVGYHDLLQIINRGQNIDMLNLDNSNYIVDENSIQHYWDRVSNGMKFYVNEMQNLRDEKFKNKTIWISVSALVLSIISIILQIVFG